MRLTEWFGYLNNKTKPDEMTHLTITKELKKLKRKNSSKRRVNTMVILQKEKAYSEQLYK